MTFSRLQRGSRVESHLPKPLVTDANDPFLAPTGGGPGGADGASSHGHGGGHGGGHGKPSYARTEKASLLGGGEKPRTPLRVTDAQLVAAAVGPAAASLDPRGPADRQRYARAPVVEVALAARERHPVVPGHHHDGVVELAALLEQLQRLADLAVPALHLKVVVGDITAHVVTLLSPSAVYTLCAPLYCPAMHGTHMFGLAPRWQNEPAVQPAAWLHAFA